MSEMMTIEDLLKELQENGKDATSEFKLRNEDIQTKQGTARIPKIKKEAKKKHKLLLPLELALPFNPMTGVADETYNPQSKFRPIMSATKVALMLKDLAARNEATKKALMSRAGVEQWDTSDATVLTDEDKAIFKRYRVPVIYTLPVVRVDIPVLTGDYGREYTLNVERDEITGNLLHPEDEPLVLQANRFFRDLAYVEVQDYQDKIDKGLINDTEKVQKETKSKIYGKNPVSDDHPSNWLICLDLPMISNYHLDTDSVDLTGMTVDDLKKNLGLLKYNKAIRDSVSKYLSGEWIKYDRYFDYFEIDMCCPAEGSTPAEIGQGTTYEKPTEELLNCPEFNKVNSCFIEYLDNREDVEKIFLASVRISNYDDSVERSLSTALSSVINLDSPWLSTDVIKRHSDFLTIVLGDKADALLLDCEMDDSGRSSVEVDEAQAKEDYDLSKMMMEDSDESVDVSEVDLLQGTVE